MFIKKNLIALGFVFLLFEAFSETPNPAHEERRTDREIDARKEALEVEARSAVAQLAALQAKGANETEESDDRQQLLNIQLKYEYFADPSHPMEQEEMLATLRDLLSSCQYGYSKLEELTPGFFKTPPCGAVIQSAFERGIEYETIQQVIQELE